MTDYKKPTGQRIERNEDTENLYKLEDDHRAAFRECALELGRVLECNPLRFYEEMLPEAILTFLDGYDQNAVRLAVEVWLEKNPDPNGGLAEMKKALDKATEGETRTLSAVRDLVFAGNKLEAIKMHRYLTGQGLTESMKAVQKMSDDIKASGGAGASDTAGEALEPQKMHNSKTSPPHPRDVAKERNRRKKS